MLHLRKKHTLKASSWVLIGHLISQLVRLAGNLLLTRLLAPEMFGIMAIVNVLIVGVQMLSDVGLGQSIIQSKKGDIPSFINTAWTLQVIRGFVLWTIILLVAGALWAGGRAGFFNEEQVYAEPVLPWLLITVGFSLVISGFNSMSIFQVSRNLTLGRLTLISLFSQLIGLTLIVFFAWKYHSIWALVIGSLVSNFIEMVFSHKFLLGIKNKWHWDKGALKELFSFGKWIFLSSVIGFIANQGDKLILGGLLAVELLGIYSIAFILASIPATIVSQISHKILFPNFSRINREAPEKLKEALSNSKLWLSLMVMPVTGVLMSWSQVIVDFLYDERYTDAGWMMTLLLIQVATACMLTPSSLVMMAKGMPQYSTVSAGLKVIFLFAVVPQAFYLFGIEIAILTIGLSELLSIPVLWFALIKYKLFSFKSEALSILLLLVGYIVGVYSLKLL
ncbi:MAG: polysaccharide biosynthesis protein [Gammaproteobacteria bacterium]|nr:MAG: polysaccharide biosynthesis protein [Gammaproteobacteria bacterium]